MKLEVRQSHDELPRIQVISENQLIHSTIRNAVLDSWMYSRAYQARIGSGAVLQGQSSNWTLVEFWQDNYQKFVDYLNNILRDEIE